MAARRCFSIPVISGPGSYPPSFPRANLAHRHSRHGPPLNRKTKERKKMFREDSRTRVSIADVLSGADPRRTSRYGLPSGCAKRQFLRGGQSPLALYGGADKTRGNETISEKTEKKYYFFTFTRHPSPASHNKIKPRYTNKGYQPPSSLSASPLSPSSSLNTP